MTALTVTGACKSYGPVRALAGVDVSIADGELLAVLGPSGCGKTTLLRCIAGLERLDAGTLVVRGRVLSAPGVHVAAHRRRVTLVPQEGALFPHLSAADNIAYGLDRAARRSGRVGDLLELVGLDGYGDRMPHQLSGGQQQRIALARALAPRPSLILLDEPFSALDAGLRSELRRVVRDALQADGATGVLVTHDQGEALSLADQVAVMRDGVVVQNGRPTDVYRSPADTWVAGFVGEAVLLTGELRDGVAYTAAGCAPVAGAETGSLPRLNGHVPVTVLVRPEQVRMAAGTTNGGVAAHVVRRDFFGHDALTTVRLEDGTELTSRTLDDSTELVPGSTVTVELSGSVRAWPSSPDPGAPSGSTLQDRLEGGPGLVTHQPPRELLRLGGHPVQ